MKLLSALGVLPKQLQECTPPAYAVCLYGGMTKRPWRTKPSNQPRDKSFTITSPVDQMEVREEWFIAQLKEKLSKQRYTYATLFVDQLSDLLYVFLQSKGHLHPKKQWKLN